MKLIEEKNNQIVFTAEMGESLANSIRRYINKIPIIVYIGVVLYVLVFSIWVIYSAYLMKREVTLKKGAVACCILGLLSLNLVAFIGGVVGLISQMQKNKSKSF